MHSRQRPFRLSSMTTIRCFSPEICLAVFRCPYGVDPAICCEDDWDPFSMFCQVVDRVTSQQWHRSAELADVSSRSLAMCPKMVSCCLMTRESTGDSLTCARTASLHMLLHELGHGYPHCTCSLANECGGYGVGISCGKLPVFWHLLRVVFKFLARTATLGGSEFGTRKF